MRRTTPQNRKEKVTVSFVIEVAWGVELFLALQRESLTPCLPSCQVTLTDIPNHKGQTELLRQLGTLHCQHPYYF